MVAVLAVSCSHNSDLNYMEQPIETDPVRADSLFRAFPEPESKSQHAW